MSTDCCPAQISASFFCSLVDQLTPQSTEHTQKLRTAQPTIRHHPKPPDSNPQVISVKNHFNVNWLPMSRSRK